MKTNEPGQEELWPRGWEGHERVQLLYWSRLPLSEKLAWLEEAEDLALNLQRARAAREAKPADEGDTSLSGPPE